MYVGGAAFSVAARTLFTLSMKNCARRSAVTSGDGCSETFLSLTSIGDIDLHNFLELPALAYNTIRPIPILLGLVEGVHGADLSNPRQGVLDSRTRSPVMTLERTGTAARLSALVVKPWRQTSVADRCSVGWSVFVDYPSHAGCRRRCETGHQRTFLVAP